MKRRAAATATAWGIIVSAWSAGCGSSGAGGTPDAGTSRETGANDAPTSHEDSSARDAPSDHAVSKPPADGSTPDAPTSVPDAGAPSCASMKGYGTEAFRDDFNGSALDTTAWDIVTGAANPSSGAFTQITNMVSANVSVSGGLLRLTTKRQCADPYTDPTTPAHPATCTPGPNYYSGAWIEAKWTAAMLAPKGLMVFSAHIPTPEPGTWPALWARNTDVHGYGEFDLIEQWYDSPAGVVNSPNDFSATTHFGTGTTPTYQTSDNQVGPFTGLDTGFHVWAVAWDSSAGTVTYSWGASLATLTALKTVTAASKGLADSGFSSSDFTMALDDSWRPYLDIGVSPADTYHESPDTAATFETAELDVDWVLMCKP
jgi:hypothetical protein